MPARTVPRSGILVKSRKLSVKVGRPGKPKSNCMRKSTFSATEPKAVSRARRIPAASCTSPMVAWLAVLWLNQPASTWKTPPKVTLGPPGLAPATVGNSRAMPYSTASSVPPGPASSAGPCQINPGTGVAMGPSSTVSGSASGLLLGISENGLSESAFTGWGLESWTVSG